MIVQRLATLKLAFNVCNRLAATTAAGVAFAAFGNTDVHVATAWGAALGAALCFSILDVVSTSAVFSIVEETRFHNVFVRSATAGLLATVTAAPVGLVALDLATHGPFAPLLLAPIAAAVALNAGVRGVATRRAPALRTPLRVVGARGQPRRARRRAPHARRRDALARHRSRRRVLCDRRPRRLARRVLRRRRRAARARARSRQCRRARRPRRWPRGRQRARARDHAHRRRGPQRRRRRPPRTRTGASSWSCCATARGARAPRAASRPSPRSRTAPRSIVSNALLHEERAIALARQVDLNRQKSDFVAAVSHELRTPLAVMLGSVHTLERLDGRMTAEQRSQLFGMTVDQGGRLQRLIDELLLVAAAEHSDVQLQREAIEIADLFASVASAAATTGRRLACGLRHRRHGGFRPLEGRAHPPQPRRERGEVRARGADRAPRVAAGTEVCLAVVDHGPGIPEADRERVFERFVQLDQSSTRRQGGTGLGLHLCRQLAELVDCRITLAETPGGGCTFTLSMPGTGRRDRGTRASKRRPPTFRSRRVGPGPPSSPACVRSPCDDPRPAHVAVAFGVAAVVAVARVRTRDIVRTGAAPTGLANRELGSGIDDRGHRAACDHLQARTGGEPRRAPRRAGGAGRLVRVRRRRRPRVA